MGAVATSFAPTPPITSWYNGQQLSVARLNAFPAHVQNLYTQLAGGFRTTRPTCMVAVSAATSIPNSTDTQMVFGTVLKDNDGMFSVVSPTQVSIHTSGWYRIALQVRWPVNSSGYRACKAMVNGTNPFVCSVAADLRPAGISAGDFNACEPPPTHLPAGSSVFANVWQSSGGNLSYQPTGSGSFLIVEWIAP